MSTLLQNSPCKQKLFCLLFLFACGKQFTSAALNYLQIYYNSFTFFTLSFCTHLNKKDDVAKAIDVPFRFNHPTPLLAYVLYGCSPNRILSSKVTSEIAYPTKIHLLNHHSKKESHTECVGICLISASFPVMRYLMRLFKILSQCFSSN